MNMLEALSRVHEYPHQLAARPVNWGGNLWVGWNERIASWIWVGDGLAKNHSTLYSMFEPTNMFVEWEICERSKIVGAGYTEEAKQVIEEMKGEKI